MTPPPPPETEGAGAPGGPDAAAVSEVRRGTLYGFLAYGIWGLFPLYFAALKPAGAFEILGHRILWTLAVCAVVLLVRRDLGWIRPFVARPRLVGGITIAALLIATNWTIYVLAVLTGRTYEAALGYFLNPIVTVALGVVVLGVLVARGETTFLDAGTGHTWLLVMAGVVTAVPLLLFAAAARRLPLVTVGLIQFITPVLQLLCGVLLLGEHVSGRLWVGFGIVWVALVLLSIDSLRSTRSARAERRRLADAGDTDRSEDRDVAPEPCP